LTDTTHDTPHPHGDDSGGDADAFEALVAADTELSSLAADTEPDPVPDEAATAQPTQPAQPTPAVPDSEPPELPLPELPAPSGLNPDKAFRFYRFLEGVYWIAISTGAVGQIVFFGSLFGLGAWGYVAATVVATTAETVMVTSGDTALRHRALQAKRRRWFPFLLCSFAAAGAAAGMNLSHFWHINISLAVLFGGVSLIGYLLHIWDGFVQGSDHLDKQAAYDAVVRERERIVRDRAEARYERWLADRETTQQAADRAVAEVTPEPTPEPTPAAKQKPGRTKKSPTQTSPSKQVAVQLGVEQGAHTPASLKAALTNAGYALPSKTTVENWCRDIKSQLNSQ